MSGAKARFEDGTIIGNIYDKYQTKNPIAKYLMKGFLRALDSLVSLSGVSQIHEVGCGEGHLSVRLAKQQKEVCASDFSEIIVSQARENAKRNKVEIHFKVCSIYQLDPKEDSSGLVICVEVLEHLKDPVAALKVLQQLANPYLIVSVPREPIWRILNFLRGKYMATFGNVPAHVQHWSRRSFVKLLAQHLDIVKILTPLPWTMVLCRRKEISIYEH